MGSCGPTTRTCLRWQAAPWGPGTELGKQGAVLLLSARWHTEPDGSCHPYPGSHRPQWTAVLHTHPLKTFRPCVLQPGHGLEVERQEEELQPLGPDRAPRHPAHPGAPPPAWGAVFCDGILTTPASWEFSELFLSSGPGVALREAMCSCALLGRWPPLGRLRP